MPLLEPCGRTSGTCPHPHNAECHAPSCNLCRAAAAAEGELIRHKAAEEAAELAAKEAAWRAKAKEMNAATEASNETLLAFKAAERQRDKQLEAAVEGEAGVTQQVAERMQGLLFAQWPDCQAVGSAGC